MSDDQRAIYLESAHDFPSPIKEGDRVSYWHRGQQYIGVVTEAWPEDDEYIFTVPGMGRLIAGFDDLERLP